MENITPLAYTPHKLYHTDWLDICPELLSSTKVLVLEDQFTSHHPRPHQDLKSLKIFEDSALCSLQTVGY